MARRRNPETPETLPALDARHKQERRALVLDALRRSGGRRAVAARYLDVAPTSVGYLVDALDLRGEVTLAGRGRPKSAESRAEKKSG